MDFQYHLYAPGLAPEFEGAMLGRDVLARNRATGQAVILKAFRRPWQPALTEDQKDIWRQVRHPALLSFLRTEPSLAEGVLYAYHAYQFEPLAEAAPGIRDAVNYSARTWAGQFADVADALHQLAQMGVHHGAINPESIVLTRVDSRLRVKDIGVTIAPGDDPDRALELLRPCLPFIAPEVFDALVQGEDVTLSAAADVYALGATMHAFFFGRPPIEPGQRPPRDVMVEVLAGELDLAEAWTELPLLTAIIHRCLHPDPAERYPGFASLAADLRYAAEAMIEFVGEDVFGLRFADSRGGEIRVLPTEVTVPPQPAAAQSEFGFFLPVDWRVDPGTRTVVRTDLQGLEPLAGAALPLGVWEFHFVQALADAAVAGPAGSFVTHIALMWLDPVESRVFHLYPGLRPRGGMETEALGWLTRVADSGLPPFVAPELLHHTRALAAGEPVPTLDNIEDTSAECSAVFSMARLFYSLMTGDVPAWDPTGSPEDLPPAYYRQQSLSVQLSELLAGCVAFDPGTRAPSASAVLADYQARAARSARNAAVDGDGASTRNPADATQHAPATGPIPGV